MLCFLAAGCGSDSSTRPTATTGYLHGYIHSMTDSVVIANASVSLIEPIPYRVVAGPVGTDASGHYVLPDAPAGNWYLFVIEGNHFMFDPERARVSVEPGDSVLHNVDMLRSELWNDDGVHYEGTVTDATTGQPIAGAFVSAMAFGVRNSFDGVPISEAITDASGHYRIEATSWLIGGVFGVAHPFGVTKEGFAPYFVADVPVGDASADTVYTLNVALAPSQAHGAIRGRVRYLNSYMRNIPVALDYSTFPVDSILGVASKGDGPRRTSLLGSAVRTDGAGRFSIGELEPGTYFIDVAFLPDDGFSVLQAIDQERKILVELKEGQTLDVGTIQLGTTMQPIAPLNGEVVSDSSPLLRWSSVPGAEFYRLSAGSTHLLNFSREVTQPFYEFEFPLPPGTPVRWIVSAHHGQDTIASFETVATFSISP